MLERVAETRASGLTRFPVRDDWAEYDILVAVEDCAYVGMTGWLIVEGFRFSAIVVDCQQTLHRQVTNQSLGELGLLADVNRSDMWHRQGVLILMHELPAVNPSGVEQARPVQKERWYE